MNINTGLGIRPELFADVESRQPEVGFFEAHSENYFGHSIARIKLLELRRDYPLSLHGVGLSLGRADDLDTSHLRQLRTLVDEVEPMLVSEHLAWSAYSHRHLPDLLPLPLHDQSLTIICQHIEQMQDALGRQILIENPSNYLLFDQLQIPEPEFLNTLAERTGCGLLLDINNIEVSARNLQRDATKYLMSIDSRAVQQYHLAGYTEVQRGAETLLIDTHNQPVYPSVWELYELALKNHGLRPTLVEWDSDFPEFDVLLAECQKADQYQKEQGPVVEGVVGEIHGEVPQGNDARLSLQRLQQDFLDQTLTELDGLTLAVAEHQGRIAVYQNNVRAAVEDYLEEVYPAFRGVVGAEFFARMCQQYLRNSPPGRGNINLYGGDFATTIEAFPALAEMPYLYDLAAYEWAQQQCYFADPGEPLDHLALPQDQLLTLPVAFNPSVQLLDSLYPLYEIHLQSLPAYADKVKIDLAQSQDSLLVCKLGTRVQSVLLSDAQASLLQAIRNSENLLQAIETLGGSLPAEEISTALALVFEYALLCEA